MEDTETERKRIKLKNLGNHFENEDNQCCSDTQKNETEIVDERKCFKIPN